MININNKIFSNYKTTITWDNFSSVISSKKIKGISPFIEFNIDNKYFIGIETRLPKEVLLNIEINKNINIKDYITDITYEDEKGWISIINGIYNCEIIRKDNETFHLIFSVNSNEIENINIIIDTDIVFNIKESNMNLYEILDKLNIDYQEISHQAVFTIEEAQQIKNMIKGIGCKNIFLTNKKGKYYLLVIEESKKADIKKIAKLTNESHLSFAPLKDLQSILNLEQGSVTPLGIINDKNNIVTLIIDKELKDKIILVHPNTNTKTISMNYTDLIRFIEYENHNYIMM